jgi:HAD superfamily hydrolase (TIGR01509 family)
MTAAELMRRRRTPLRLVIYDCDGVLVDSEPIANRATAHALARVGWPITPEEAQERFLGMTLTDMVPVIETTLGRKLPSGWKEALTAELVTLLGEEAVAVPGAVEALRATTALGLPWRIASNSSHEEMAAKFGRLGISELVAGRLHSHRDVARGKPAPDLVLAAAAAERVSPADCVVIEDSLPGARAASAAGMDCLGFARHTDPDALRALGAVPFRAMLELPGLFALAPRAPG